jgi:hypothetical protein
LLAAGFADFADDGGDASTLLTISFMVLPVSLTSALPLPTFQPNR